MGQTLTVPDKCVRCGGSFKDGDVRVILWRLPQEGSEAALRDAVRGFLAAELRGDLKTALRHRQEMIDAVDGPQQGVDIRSFHPSCYEKPAARM